MIQKWQENEQNKEHDKIIQYFPQPALYPLLHLNLLRKQMLVALRCRGPTTFCCIDGNEIPAPSIKHAGRHF
jgi:hypothetical protein